MRIAKLNYKKPILQAKSGKVRFVNLNKKKKKEFIYIKQYYRKIRKKKNKRHLKCSAI